MLLILRAYGYTWGLWAIESGFVCLVFFLFWFDLICHPEVQQWGVWVSSHELGLKLNQEMIGYSRKLCATIALVKFAALDIKEFEIRLVFSFLLW